MHVHLPKPLHGWREFMGEVGIIVLGVLIALGAEQFVEALHWRAEAREFREAVDHELALNLGTYAFNELQRPCIRRRLDELQTVLDHAGKDGALHLTGTIGTPAQFSQYSSVWDNKNADVVAHLPLEARLKYAELYDEFRNTQGLKSAQDKTWIEFVPFEVPGPLSLDDRRKLYALIKRARDLDWAMKGNWPVSEKLGLALGIRPELPPENIEVVKNVRKMDICKPVLARK